MPRRRGPQGDQPQLRLLDLPEPPTAPPPSELLYQHATLAQTSLPYRNPGDHVREWERSNGGAYLKLVAGEILHPRERRPKLVGLPYGPKPRLILAHLNGEALRTGSREIEIARSLTAFVKRIGLYQNGETITTVKQQLVRLSAASVRLGMFTVDENRVTRSEMLKVELVEYFDLWATETDERGRVPWQETIRLGSTYFESLQEHSVPLHPYALGALSTSAMALDVYTWLAQRLHRVAPGRPQPIAWARLKEQFGWHYERMVDFRRDFRATLRMVLDQYQTARLDLDEHGVALHYSPTPVPYRQSILLHRADDGTSVVENLPSNKG